MIRRHITFYGRVQGVGFRYRARHAAELYHEEVRGTANSGKRNK